MAGTQHSASLAISEALSGTHLAQIRVNRRHVAHLEGKAGKAETAGVGDPLS